MLNSLKLEDINPTQINLTGVRLLVLFSLLMEAPRTAEEINEYFVNNNYPNDIISLDTIRNDVNSLRSAGCDISRADKHNGFKYTLFSHPFELNIDLDVAKSLSKIYNRVYNHLSVNHLILIDDLLESLANYTPQEDVYEYLKGISLLKNINKSILNDLIKARDKKSKIKFTYKAPNTGKHELEFVVNDLEIRNKKLYFNGYCVTYESNSFLLVSKVVSDIEFLNDDEAIKSNTKTVIYELKNLAKINFTEKQDDKIIEETSDKIIVQHESENDFKLMQKILAYGPNCTVISPEDVKLRVIDTLKRMREVYCND